MISLAFAQRACAFLGQRQRHHLPASYLSSRRSLFSSSGGGPPPRQQCLHHSHLSSTTKPNDYLDSRSNDNSEDNSKYLKRYRIRGSTAEQSGGVGVRLLTNTGHIVQTDLPRRMGGTDQAAQPVETLLAALIGCTQATAVFVIRHIPPKGQWKIDRLEFDLHAERDERGSLHLPIEETPDIPSRLQSISGVVRVYASEGETIPESVLMLLQEQTEVRCPVANMMIASGCQINVVWVDGNS